MARIERFEEIEAWKGARTMTNAVYAASNRGAFSRDYALRDQVRRAAVSVMANIAEGFERGGDKEFLHFLSLAKASAAEVRSHLYIALDQKYLDAAQFEEIIKQAESVGRMLSRFMDYLQTSDLRGTKFRTGSPPAKRGSTAPLDNGKGSGDADT